MKHLVILSLGIVATILFLIFATNIFELFYYEMQFSNEMYNEGLYFVTSLTTVLLAWGIAAIYYYVINSVAFSRWYHWLTMMIASCVAVVVFDMTYLQNAFAENGLDFSRQLGIFSMVNIITEILLFTIASFSIRWWSVNCRHTPIPE